jgi:glutamyl-tRNA reductase
MLRRDTENRSGGMRIVPPGRGMYASDVSPDLSFHVIGVSHHTAPVGVRERFASSPAEVRALLEREHSADRTALLLSTCNRCELYWSGDQNSDSWFREFARERGVTEQHTLTRLDGLDAVRHLFTVAAGLDSQILGETEILGQVRGAYDAARAAGATGREMDAIFSAALATGRRVRSETLLGRHPASVSSAAVDLAAADRANGLEHCRAVVLGAGEAAEGVLRALHQHKVERTTLVNRNPDRAGVLATAWGAVARPWSVLDELLRDADLLIVATAAARPVISAQQLAQATAGPNRETLTVMDLAVPRNVEPAARALPRVCLYDLDDLQRLCCPAAGTASVALTEAERVVTEEIVRLEQSLRSRAAAPRLAELHRIGAEMAEQEAAWALAQLAVLSDRERQVVREMADRLVRRVLYPASRSLREEG